jgi:hypothetical protein
MNDQEGKESKSGLERYTVLNGTKRLRCQKMKKSGEQCGGFVSDYERDLCRIHALPPGVGTFGGMTAAEATRKSIETKRARVRMRQVIAPNGIMTPRGALRLKAWERADALAQVAVDGALSESVPLGERARLSLAIVKEADPGISVEVEAPANVEDLEKLSMPQLRLLAQAIETGETVEAEAVEAD